VEEMLIDIDMLEKTLKNKINTKKDLFFVKYFYHPNADCA
jgi:hypothetical protein